MRFKSLLLQHFTHIQSTFWLQRASLWYVEGTAELVKDFLLLHILCNLLINSYMTLITAEAHTSFSMQQDRAGEKKSSIKYYCNHELIKRRATFS